MANFLAELKRRHLYRVAAAYAVVAWVLIQLVNNVAPALRLPEWAPTLVIVLLFVGFPIVLLIAWMRELAPADGSTARAVTGRLDWFLASALVVVIALVSYEQLTPTRTAQVGVEVARAASATQAGAISIAVLPFTNLSGDASQEFFSDGMTEEITTALAKISDLRVVARTSAYQFKGEKKDMRALGQALGATHLIEGSVRKAGARVRITAQLIKTDDGTHIWSENYDRELTDVFAIQEDIATAIAGALRMPLGLAPGERLVSSRTIDPESYQQYLRARPLVRGGARGVPQAIKILEPLVVRNRDFAPAWALLANAYGRTPFYSRNGSIEELRHSSEMFHPKAEAAARRALQLDPDLAEAYLSLARVQLSRGKWLMAEELFSKGLALDPNNSDVLTLASSLPANVGRLNESVAMKQQLRALEPYVPAFNIDVAEILWVNGQDAAAIALLRDVPLTGNPGGDLARIYAAQSRYSEAANVLQAALATGPLDASIIQAATNLLRTAPAVAASPQSLPRLSRFGFVYLYVGAPSRALEYYEDMAQGGLSAGVGADVAFLWHSSFAAVRKTERFKALVRKNGMVDYWRAKGWPQFCHPTTADDFACE